jgi:small subunit ribosomal protein S17
VSAKKTQAQPEKKARRDKPPQPEATQPEATQPEQVAQQEQESAPASQAKPQAAAPVAEAKGARTLTGRVVSNKMQKTIAVEIERLIRHPTYGKYIRRTTKLLAHDENGTSKEGDLVVIGPCRPMSRRKSWRLLEVVQRASGT